ncbi:MAG TPA: histidine kinase [Candidatus Limnocylindrales bacterium]|nr:histidine kinase [Candidatus Limnocylindrales bacterium]
MGARRLATWSVLGASLAVAALFVVLRLTIPSDGGRIAFYEDAWSAGGVVISPIDQPQPGLAPGDRVAAIDGRSMEAWADAVVDGGVQRPAGGPLPYLLGRDGSAVDASVTWAAPNVSAALLEGWSIAVFSIAMAAVAALVFRRRPDVPAATALVLVACGAAGSSVPWFLGATTSDLVQGGPFALHAALTAGVYMLMWPAAVHLGLVFPAPIAVVRRRPGMVWLPYLVALGGYALALAISRVTTPSTLEWVGTWPRIQLVVVVPCILLWLAFAIIGFRRAGDPVARSRIRWAAMGALTSAILGLALFQLPELLFGRSLVPTSWVGLIALPLPIGLAIGILHDHLFDIDVVLNRTLVYGGLTLGVITTYAIAVAALGGLIGPDQAYGVSLLATGISALVALPLRDLLQRTVNRLLYGSRHEPWRAMRRLGQRLEWAAEPDRAFPAIVETVADALRLPYVALEVTDETGELRAAAVTGVPSAAQTTVPLVSGAETVGRLVLGVRSGERGFHDDELALLADLGRQAGTAVGAIRLRDDLVRSRERLVVAREEERRRLRRDLHDGLGPTLAAIGMRAEASAATLDTDPGAARALLDELAAEVGVALADVRRLVDGLRPPAIDEVGLVAAIDQQARRLEGGSGHASLRISVAGAPSPLPELPAAVEVAAYRIAVEAVTNAVRHADARTCRVRIAAGRTLEIEVADDGTGNPAGFVAGTGMESMSARAEELGGELRVEPQAGGGTRVLARLPLAGPAAT